MTKEDIQEGYYQNCIIGKNLPDHLKCAAGYTHDGWFQGAEWASKEVTEKACEYFLPRLKRIGCSPDGAEEIIRQFKQAMDS